MFELGDDGQGGEQSLAVRCRADDAVGGDGGDGSGYSFEEESVFAETACERESSAVFEPDGVWYLAFKRADLLRLVRGRRRGNAVLSRVEPETFGEVDGIRAGYGGTETFDGREYLLVEVPFDVWS